MKMNDKNNLWSTFVGLFDQRNTQSHKLFMACVLIYYLTMKTNHILLGSKNMVVQSSEKIKHGFRKLSFVYSESICIVRYHSIKK